MAAGRAVSAWAAEIAERMRSLQRAAETARFEPTDPVMLVIRDQQRALREYRDSMERLQDSRREPTHRELWLATHRRSGR